MIESDLDETEINDILIVGDSDTSFEFSQQLQDINVFTRVIHVIKSEDAVKLLVQENFSVIIIDEDADDVDSISLSRNIRDTLPLARIIIISTSYHDSFIRELINEASVDALIPIPIDTFSASSVIIEQYAKYQINSTLYNLVTKDPPKFSPSYYLFHDPTLDQTDEGDLQFMGLVVIYASLTKFAKFYSEMFQVDEYLITGYISAISLLGEQLFEDGSSFKEINFGGLSVVMHTEGDVQYLFFFKELSKQSYQTIENEINRVIRIINIHYFNFLNSELPTPSEIDEEIEIIADRFYDTHKKIIDYTVKQHIVYIGSQTETITDILHSDHQKYNLHKFSKPHEVIDYLLNYDVDILIIDQTSESISSLTLATQAKDILPGLQIIALMSQFTKQNLMRTLNDDYIDFVFSSTDLESELEKIMDLAFEQSLKIKTQLVGFQPHNIQYSLHRSVVTRSMLRSHDLAFRISKIPEFYGVFIMQEDIPYFTKLLPSSENTTLDFDEQLFAGFISSMEMFNDELFAFEEYFSGFKFGETSILIRKQLSFTFVFFLGNVDHTNFPMIEKQLAHSSNVIHDTIINSEGFFDYDIRHKYDITELIEYHVNELLMHLVSLNFFE